MQPVGRTAGDRTGNRGVRIAVMEDGGRGQDLPGEPGGGDDVVVLGSLIKRDQHGQGLTDMDVEGIVDVLKSVRSFYFHKLHLVALDPEVDRGRHAHIRDPEEVSLPCTMHHVLLRNVTEKKLLISEAEIP